jgi:serine/threonine-protein kinase RsbW
MADFLALVPTEPSAISVLTERATAYLAESGVDQRAAHHVALVLDELLTNVATHGGAMEEPASVRLVVSPDRVMGEVVDCGSTFDPRQRHDVDVSAAVEDRPIGGLGLLLLRQVTERVDYERVGDRNRTTFWICRAASSA